mmetsp:Transcript_29704/g.58864  ORF Transcript_29704/g.58864 Transcript_29704/m.58864 type:complete len:185 (-) Transcript_29704:245-799(-)
MKSVALIGLVIGSAAAFAPSTNQRQTVSMNAVDRRTVFGQIAGAAAVVVGVPSIALADGAVSKATIARSRGIYGSRVAALEDAVAAGDFGAVAAEKNAFILFNSGAYAKNKTKQAEAIAGTNAIFAAIRGKDKAALSSAYKSYIAANNITPMQDVTTSGKNAGQGFGGDNDYRARTKAGAVYQR